jgi:hypothetical protein
MCFASSVQDAKGAEQALVAACCAHPALRRRTDLGREYFEGSLAIVKQLAHLTSMLFCPAVDGTTRAGGLVFKATTHAGDGDVHLEEVLKEAFDCKAGPKSYVSFRDLYDTLVVHGVGPWARKVDMTEKAFGMALTKLGYPSGTARLSSGGKPAKVRYGLSKLKKVGPSAICFLGK